MLDFFDKDELRPYDFYELLLARGAGSCVPCAVLADDNGTPRLHKWPRPGEDDSEFLARVTKDKWGGYFTPATFRLGPDGERHRLKKLAHTLKCFWADLEGPNKKDGHPSQEATLAASNTFANATGLTPTVTVLTGSGGAHLYWGIDAELSQDQWQGRAHAFVSLAAMRGLKIDAPITTDAARVLRGPGSIHQKTGVTVRAYRTGETYNLDDLDKLLSYTPGTAPARKPGALSHPVNAALDLSGDKVPQRHKPFSMQEAAKHCTALRMTMENRGATTPYQPWILALQTARLSTEGEGLGHAISEGHPDYDRGEVDRKMDSFTGGPPSCETWHLAWGEKSPCHHCLYGGISK